jgi:HEAT repeat protein
VSHPIIERLRNPDPDERRAACRDAISDPAATLLVDALGEALGDPVKTVARAASEALARLAREVDGVEEIVHRALRSDDASQRWHAVLVSSRIEPPSPRLLPPTVEALASEESDVRWTAARLLVEAGRVNPEVLPLVIGLVRAGESTRVRCMAVYCVRELAPELPESAVALLDATRDPEILVRRAALTALAGLTDPTPDVFDRLSEVMEEPSDAGSRTIAAHALGVLGAVGGARVSETSLRTLRRIAATESDRALQAAARRALNRVDPERTDGN